MVFNEAEFLKWVRDNPEKVAKALRTAQKFLENKETQDAKAIHDANLATAQSWFDSLPEHDHEPMSRDEALFMFNNIKQLLTTETDRFRQSILRKELNLANEKYKEVKKNI